METKVSQEPAIDPCSEPDEFSPKTFHCLGSSKESVQVRGPV